MAGDGLYFNESGEECCIPFSNIFSVRTLPVEIRAPIEVVFSDNSGQAHTIQFMPSVEQDEFFAPEYRIEKILNERKDLAHALNQGGDSHNRQ